MISVHNKVDNFFLDTLHNSPGTGARLPLVRRRGGGKKEPQLRIDRLVGAADPLH